MNASPLVDCVAASGRHYPGDTVTVFLRAEQAQAHRLRLVLPEGIALSDYRALTANEMAVPFTNTQGDILEWVLDDDAPTQEFEVDLRVLETFVPVTLAAVVQLIPEGQEAAVAEAWGTLHVDPKSNYLRYLPALYARDDFMGRFLMLFESFWNPIDNQIDSIANYFDPMLTPPRLLSWLGTWLNVDAHSELPEHRQRRLIQRASRLYRQRGTKAGLEAMLELWTDGKAAIVEHRSQNLRLGKNMRLGRTVALGNSNAPHSFTVRICLPHHEADEPPQRHQRVEQMRPVVERILQKEKPAHTTYALEIS